MRLTSSSIQTELIPLSVLVRAVLIDLLFVMTQNKEKFYISSQNILFHFQIDTRQWRTGTYVKCKHRLDRLRVLGLKGKERERNENKYTILLLLV